MTHSSKHIVPLTSLRAFAAFWVICWHIGVLGYVWYGNKLDWGIFQPIMENGGYGVDMFFIISGFVLSSAYGRHFSEEITRKKLVSFYLLRLARIYPIHIFTILLVLIFHITGLVNNPMAPGNFFSQLTLTHAWGYIDISWNIPSWSISIEWFAYLLFPMIYLFLFPTKGLWKVLSIITLVTIVYHYVYTEFSTMYILSNNGVGAFIRIGHGFLIGCLLFILYNEGYYKNLNWDVIFILTLTTAIMLMYYQHYLPDDEKLAFTVVYSPFPLLILSLAYSRRWVMKFMSNKILVYLGKISYSTYMMQSAIAICFNKILQDTIGGNNYEFNQSEVCLYILLYFVVLVTASSLTYHCIENPIRNFVKDKVKNSHTN